MARVVTPIVVALALAAGCTGETTVSRTATSPTPLAPAPRPTSPPYTAALIGFVYAGETRVPVSGASVSIMDGLSRGRSTTTDSSGRYRLEGLQPGFTLIWASAKGHDRAETRVWIDGTATLDVILVPLPKVTVSGTVRDIESGIGIAGAQIEILRDLTTTVAPEDWGRTTTTDNRGIYTFENVAAGNANLSAIAAGYVERRAGTNINSKPVVDFELRRIPGPETFTGQVGWTEPPRCIFKFGGDGLPPPAEYACAEYPFEMRRSGAIDVTVTWQGTTETALQVQLVHQVFGVLRQVRGTAGANRQIAFSQTAFWAGAWMIRIINYETYRLPSLPAPPVTQTPFTLTLTRWD